MPFQPQVNQAIAINAATYRVREHPASPGMPWGQEARRAVIYSLRSDDGRSWALKVFKPEFRQRGRGERIASGADRISRYAALRGLAVCDRTVLVPEQHPALVSQYDDLAYAVLMPWMAGQTWQEIVEDGTQLSMGQSRVVALAFAQTLAMMELWGLAHCDLSNGNVLVEQASADVNLVDLEDLYAPGFPQPDPLPGGSPGYGHRTAPTGNWSPQADRFAGAVLLGEMLGWCDPRVRQRAYGETYFNPAEVQTSCERFGLLTGVLADRWGKPVAQAFYQAWNSATLADCPSMTTWTQVIQDAQPRAVTVDQQPKPRNVPEPQPGPLPEPPPTPRPAAGLPWYIWAVLAVAAVAVICVILSIIG